VRLRVCPSGSVGRCVCLLLQYLLQSCSRGGRWIVEDMCYERRRGEAGPLDYGVFIFLGTLPPARLRDTYRRGVADQAVGHQKGCAPCPPRYAARSMSPGGGEQAQRHHPSSLSSESGHSLRHVGYSAIWGLSPFPGLLPPPPHPPLLLLLFLLLALWPWMMLATTGQWAA
jgi:hypothetical protein